MKIITGVRAGIESPGFPEISSLADLVAELGKRVGVVRLTINQVVPAPEFLPPRPIVSALAAPYDAIVMAWLPASATVADWVDGLSGVAPSARYDCDSFLVDEIVEKDGSPMRAGETTPGIRNLPFLVCQDGLSDADWRGCWDRHGRMALRMHTGMERYVRNVVTSRLSPQCPFIQGIAETDFPTLDDLRFGQFPTDADRDEFIRDVSGWARASTPHYAIEHVVLCEDPPAS